MSVHPGLYRHYKGRLYQVIETATHSETLERLVVYRALYGEGGLWVRPEAMFAQTVGGGRTGPAAVRAGRYYLFQLTHIHKPGPTVS